MLSSPTPVEPPPPTSGSTNKPAPITGESPTRPGIFQASPDVVVTPEISPFSFKPRQLMVPYVDQKCQEHLIWPESSVHVGARALCLLHSKIIRK